MKDISLDDEIKKDKQKQRLNRNNKGENRGGARRFKQRGTARPERFEKSRPGFKRHLGNDRIDRNDRGDQNRPRFDRNTRDGQPKRLNRINKNRDQPREAPVKKEPTPRSQNTEQEAAKQEKGRTLRVLGLHPDINNQDLYKLFAAEGALQKCMIEQDNFGRNLPSAIVKYYAAETAKKAIQKLNNQKLLNSVLTVEPYKYRK